MKNAFAKGGFIDAADGSGHRIYYESYGPEDAPPFIMVHGNAGYIFDPQKLSMWDLQKQRVIIIHARGIGNSRPLGKTEYNLYPHLAEDIETIRAHLKLGRIALFGWSAGAAVSLLYAQNHPEHCRSITLYGAFLGTQHELRAYYARSQEQYPAGWAKFCAQYGAEDQFEALHNYHNEILNGSAAAKRRAVMRYESIFGSFAASAQELTALTKNRAIYANMIEQGFGLNDNRIEANMHRLRDIPVRFIRGENDYIGSPRPGETLIKNAGHDIHDPRIQKYLKTSICIFTKPPPPLSRPFPD